MNRLRTWWLRLLDWLAPEQAATFAPPRLTVELAPFNWLEDYGPHWEPGSTAFWLEPRRERDLSAWLRKYRPDFVGEFDAAGLTVVVEPLVRCGRLWKLMESTGSGTHVWGAVTTKTPASADTNTEEQGHVLEHQRALYEAILEAELTRAQAKTQAALTNARMQNNCGMFNASYSRPVQAGDGSFVWIEGDRFVRSKDPLGLAILEDYSQRSLTQ